MKYRNIKFYSNKRYSKKLLNVQLLIPYSKYSAWEKN